MRYTQQSPGSILAFTKEKTAANSLARGFLTLNLLIPLINF